VIVAVLVVPSTNWFVVFEKVAPVKFAEVPNNAPPTPRPPVTTRAPVVVLLEVVAFVTEVAPDRVFAPFMVWPPSLIIKFALAPESGIVYVLELLVGVAVMVAVVVVPSTSWFVVFENVAPVKFAEVPNSAPPTPRPPVTTRAPVLVLLEAVAFVTKVAPDSVFAPAIVWAPAVITNDAVVPTSGIV
jgi:hypothetical protein